MTIPRALRQQHFQSGMTLVEVLVACGLGLMVLTIALTLFAFGIRSFAGLGNYAVLSGQSRLSMDLMSREMRKATQVTGANMHLPIKWLALTNAIDGTTNLFTWDSTSGILTWVSSAQPLRTNLTGCDEWDFSFYQRSPQTNWVFYPATNSAGVLDLSACKLIDMSWKCSRTMLGVKMNTEEVQTSQFVLRNKM